MVSADHLLCCWSGCSEADHLSQTAGTTHLVCLPRLPSITSHSVSSSRIHSTIYNLLRQNHWLSSPPAGGTSVSPHWPVGLCHSVFAHMTSTSHGVIVASDHQEALLLAVGCVCVYMEAAGQDKELKKLLLLQVSLAWASLEMLWAHVWKWWTRTSVEHQRPGDG